MGTDNLAFLYSLPQEHVPAPSISSSEDSEDSSDVESSEEEENDESSSNVLLPGPVKKRKKKHHAKPEEGLTEDSTKRVFVGKLPKHFTESQIREIFTRFGAITSITNSWGYVPDNGKYKGVAIVNFADVSAAHAAISATLSVEGNELIIKPHTKLVKKPKQAVGSRTLFVGNLPFGVSKQALAQLFAPCGTVLSVRLPTNPETKKPLGFGFVVFQGLVHMKLANKLNGHMIAGRAITVGEQKKVVRDEKKGNSSTGGAKPTGLAKSGSQTKLGNNAVVNNNTDTKKRKGLTGAGSDQVQSRPPPAKPKVAPPAPTPVTAVASAFCGKRVKLG